MPAPEARGGPVEVGPEPELVDSPLVAALSEFARTLTGRYEISEVLYRRAEHVMDIRAWPEPVSR
ncbi:MAG TPA: hypothetical protein VFA11_16275 [Acidimicrobiales bacterium]|nr:hypothetical protein [Acidimicrobiales bacterium]